MENLKQLIDSKSLDEIDKILQASIDSTDQVGNQLKLCYVLVSILERYGMKLNTISLEDYVSAVKTQVKSANEKIDSTKQPIISHIQQNKQVLKYIIDGGTPEIKNIESQLDELLKQYDLATKDLVELQSQKHLENIIGEQHPPTTH
ncbi:MAG: hypothetical protein R3Y26_00350 [Rikenellaceae bacterium]